jgi:polyphosphate kinase 2
LRGPICKSKDNGADKPTKIKKKDKKLKKDFKREEVLEKEEEGDPIGELYPRPSWEGIKRSAHVSDDTFAKREKPPPADGKRPYKYKKELKDLQAELVKLQEYIKEKGLRVVTIFEGRDAAGKGGIIRRIGERTSPRTVIVNALGTPSDKEKTQWYFQRYVPRLPAAGEWVIFDRSWYNRAGVEKVMGFCTDAEYKQFLKTCPLFENLLIDSGIILIKYWVSVSAKEQAKRFEDRLKRPEKRWKLSPIDLYARSRWSDYSYAKDVMFSHTDTSTSPWHVIDGNDKKAARLNAIKHILSVIPYEDIIQTEDIKIPPKQEDNYERPPLREQTFVPQDY